MVDPEKQDTEKIQSIETTIETVISDSDEKILMLASQDLFDLYGNLPESIFDASHVAVLNIADNGLRRLSDNIAKLINLNNLNISKNSIRAIPDSIMNLKSLVTLNAAYNELSYIPDNLGELKKLNELSLEFNNLSSLPSSLGSSPNLRWLVLDGNPINTVEIPNEILINDDLNILFEMESLHEVIPGIFLGGKNSERKLDIMEKHNISRILSVVPSTPSHPDVRI
eukprot:TRINITY_DN979_c4_g1_i3.p1 TRINITY_DN979_c4_g1~~TRINITY_DN979_c4_g1_i3.p1  ORF type:complete len:226 (-),score=45.87 TRINITY_DN979_c4_g1_i3:408-1085(-)